MINFERGPRRKNQIAGRGSDTAGGVHGRPENRKLPGPGRGRSILAAVATVAMVAAKLKIERKTAEKVGRDSRARGRRDSDGLPSTVAGLRCARASGRAFRSNPIKGSLTRMVASGTAGHGIPIKSVRVR